MAAEVWSYIQLTDGRLDETARKMASEAFRVARLIGATPGAVALAAAGQDDPAVAELLRHGVEQVRLGRPAGPDGAGPDWAGAELAALVETHRPTLVLFPATSVGADVAARVAARLRCGVIANCVDFEVDGDRLVARAVVGGGKAHRKATWASGGVRIATMDMGSLEAIAQDVPGAVTVTPAPSDPAGRLVRVRSVRRWRLPPDEIDLTEADFVLGVGRPVDRERDLPAIQVLADRLGATVGGSRVAVFQGTVPRTRQIGSSGKWIRPTVYLMLGISGASYHMMGIKGAKHIIAVNRDPDAPIFKVAELGVVGDFAEVVAALLAASEAAAGQEAVA
ncbi:MAG: electron transfer flavoprotein subunit alpha/FixB family protein [Solirubrobacterales bacterium]